MWDGVVIDTFVEVLTVGMRVDALVIVSNVTVDLLMDALTGIIRRGVRTDDVGVLVDLNVNVLPHAMTAFEFAVPEPFEGFRC